MLNLDTEHELYALSEEECLEEEPVLELLRNRVAEGHVHERL